MSKLLLNIVCIVSLVPAILIGAQAKKSQSPTPETQWTHLIDTRQVTKAQQLCTQWETSGDIQKQVEAEKCLANVALAKGSHLSLEGKETGGGTLGTGYTAEAVDAALGHLNKGIALAPQDISLHEGRLHVLEVSGRFDAMMKALEESINTYKGPGTPEVWLAYAAELGNDGEPTAGLHLCEILNRHYPDNSDIIGNLGAFHNMLKQWDQGLPYVRKAVEMHPTDPIDTWNLGWSLYHVGQLDEANKWMSRSVDLDPKGTDVPGRNCLYGQFLVTQMKQEEYGCMFVKTSCEPDNQLTCK